MALIFPSVAMAGCSKPVQIRILPHNTVIHTYCFCGKNVQTVGSIQGFCKRGNAFILRYVENGFRDLKNEKNGNIELGCLYKFKIPAETGIKWNGAYTVPDAIKENCSTISAQYTNIEFTEPTPPISQIQQCLVSIEYVNFSNTFNYNFE